MNILSNEKFLMMGLPDSGKSTFVAALWEVVRSSDVPDAMMLGTLSGDYSYIRKLHKLWSEGKRLPRTEVGEEGIISIPLRNRSSGSQPIEEIEIILPDLSGESFNQQWEMRTMMVEYHAHLTEASGILLFVHSQKFNPGELLGFRTKELEGILEFGDTEEQEPEPKEESVNPATPNIEEDITSAEESDAPLEKAVGFQRKDTPTQTKVVDLLQQALWLTDSGQIRKVALIISAWDLVCDRIGTPEEWVESAMPLLSQYLKSNKERFHYNIYGVSAQGDRYNKESRISLLNLPDQSKRIKITDGKIKNNNITAPLQWLMNDSK